MKKLIYALCLLTGLFVLPLAQAQTGGGESGSAQSDVCVRGEELFKQQRYDDAIIMLNQCVQNNPNSARAFFVRGRCYFGMGAKFLKLSFNDYMTAAEMGYCTAYDQLARYYETYLRNMDSTIHYYQMASECEQQVDVKISYQLQIIDLLFKAQRYADAVPILNEARETLPLPDLDFKLAQYYNMTGEYVDPADLNKALDLLNGIEEMFPPVPGNEEYYFERGKTHHLLGNYEQSRKDWEIAIVDVKYVSSKDWYSAEAYLARAQAFYQVNDYSTSETYLGVAITLGITDAEASKQAEQLLANLALKKQDNTQEIEYLRTQIDNAGLPPKTRYDSYKKLANLEFNAKNFGFAIDACDGALGLAANDPEMIFLKSMAQYKTSQFEESAANLNALLKYPGLNKSIQIRLTFSLGLIYYKEGDLEKAEAAFKSAAFGPYRYAAYHEYSAVNFMRTNNIEPGGF